MKQSGQWVDERLCMQQQLQRTLPSIMEAIAWAPGAIRVYSLGGDAHGRQADVVWQQAHACDLWIASGVQLPFVVPSFSLSL